MLPLVAALVSGYLLGSIPTAYLVVRWKSRLDIRTAGSGNVGTLNSYLVTKSKIVGILVLLVDLLKGLSAVAVAPLFGGAPPFMAQTLGALGAVAGQNFPVWLKGKGGRGLATAAGAMLPLVPWAVLLWVVAWSGAFAIMRKVNPANAVATLLVVLAGAAVPGSILQEFLPEGASVGVFRILVIVVMGLVFIRHIGPLKEFSKERQEKKGDAAR